ncbi:hypothetical protein G443_004089 [Actinoalloteichus cyanogriseus DSM 43889]|uniref:Ferredoxin n=2 Tax=Actinoalloteichus cyanogriseus TaxID=2893586 RepID=A0ABT1JMR3_ACTCY|nr:hypothetical protein [Actinoalloteichus caeruleus DSM 43889]
MRVNVDVDVCRTAGQCVVLAPDVVDQSAEAGRVIPLAAPAEALAAGVREGHRRLPCPASGSRPSERRTGTPVTSSMPIGHAGGVGPARRRRPPGRRGHPNGTAAGGDPCQRTRRTGA